MNYHKGFISPLLLALVAILLIGGGAYVYVHNKPIKQSDTATQSAHATSAAQTSNQSVLGSSLSLDRLKAKDALIKSDLSQVQQQAKINYAEIGKDYVGFCTDTFVVKTLANIRIALGITPTTCNSSATAVAASSPLAVDSTKFWCIDSTGFNGQMATPLGSSTVCPK